MATKKPVTKKIVAKKKASVKTASPKKTPPLRSFRLSKEVGPFFAFALTRQTFYWVIIALAFLCLGIWTISLQVKVNNIYDQVELNQTGYENQSIKKLSH